ncbi:MAG: NAD(P)H-dependent glycerol-3-phosphate dehydrogenase [Bacilli bacterium]
MKIAIIGTGVYGIAMANSLLQNKNNDIIMWSESEESLNRLEASRGSFEPLGAIKLNDRIKFTTSYEEALNGAKIVFIMCAAKFVSSVCNDMIPYITKDMQFVIGSKGIEQGSCRFIHEVFLTNIKTKNYAVISGPSFAIDIANLEPIGLSIASPNKNTISIVKGIYKNTNIKLRETKDVIGIELCGAIKNVIAVASGILEGLGYSESTRSFLLTESLHDIKELINGLGGNKNTILSFAGVGDLLMTATSTKSRNYSYGILLGEGKYDEANEYLNTTTVEGYYTLKSIYILLRKKKIKMPVIDLIYKIVMKNEDPSKLSEFLMKK